MVLTHQVRFNTLSVKLIFSLFFFALLSACSHLKSTPTSNSSPTKPVIAVLEANIPEKIPPQRNNTTQQESNLNQADQALITTQTAHQFPQPAPTDVLGSIIHSAKKAINLQQWLRAQRHLEHALRVAPKDAEVYYIYADVYEGLGVQDQAVNMLKRAKFLAKPTSDIYQLSSERLKSLDQ